MDDQELQDIIDGVMRFTCSLCGARTWAPRKLLERIPKGMEFMLECQACRKHFPLRL